MKHEICVTVDKFSGNDVERLRHRKCFNCFLRLFHVFIELYINASLPCDILSKDFTLSIPFSEHDVSYLCVSDEKTLKIAGN